VLAKAAPLVPLVIAHGPDFNSDGEVSGFDFLAWQRGVGITSNATAQQGDSDGDGDVDNDDLADWEAEYGASASAPLAGAQASESDPSAQLSGSEQLSASAVVEPQFGIEFQTTSSASYGGNEGSLAEAASDAEQTGSNAPNAVAARGPSSAPIPPELSTAQPIASTAVGDDVQGSVDQTSGISLASLASEASKRFQHGSRYDRDDHELLRPARIETQSTETSFNDSIDLMDLGFVMRDRALDRLFGRRERLFEQLPWNRDQQEDESADALEAVLGEEIEWRLL